MSKSRGDSFRDATVAGGAAFIADAIGNVVGAPGGAFVAGAAASFIRDEFARTREQRAQRKAESDARLADLRAQFEPFINFEPPNGGSPSVSEPLPRPSFIQINPII